MLWKAISGGSLQRHIRTRPFIRTFTGTTIMSNLPYSEAWLAGPSSTQFYTRTYTPVPPVSTKAAIVFVHGFAEHVGRYTHFHPLLSARGIAVFAYDQRGFGLTAQDTKGNKSKSSAYGKTCWKDQMADIEWAVEHTRKSFEDKPVFLMGHSMVNFTALVFNFGSDILFRVVDRY